MDLSWLSLLGFVSFAVATCLSANQIMQHLRHFHHPDFQLYICRIILMVPIYATQSFVSCLFPSIAVYLDTIRDCYEAYVVYIFLSLLIQYLGGESIIILHFEMMGRIAHPWPFSRALKPLATDRRFFRTVKQGCLQFVFVKPLAAGVTLILETLDLHGAGTFDFHRGFLYLAVVNNLSVWVAMYSLILFYLATKERLAPFRPLSKFLCVKAIIFFSFWQSILVAVLIQWGIIPSSGGLDARSAAQRIQDALVCIEMLGFAVAHSFAFSYRDFVDPDSRHNKPILANLQKVLNMEDVLKDAHEVFWKSGDGLDVPLQEMNSSKNVQTFDVSSDSDDEGGELDHLMANSE